jgi:hypothetical protein
VIETKEIPRRLRVAQDEVALVKVRLQRAAVVGRARADQRQQVAVDLRKGAADIGVRQDILGRGDGRLLNSEAIVSSPA